MKITDEMVYRALAWFYPCEDWPPETEPTAADEIAFRRDRMEVMRGTLKAAFTGGSVAAMATITTIRLRTVPDNGLDGYLFSDEMHARQWLSHKLIRDHVDDYYLERLEISGEEATCPTCSGSGYMPRVFRVLGRMAAAEFLRINELRESE